MKESLIISFLAAMLILLALIVDAINRLTDTLKEQNELLKDE